MDSSFASTVEMFPQPILGIVEEPITSNQRGRVKFDGTYWPARFYEADCQTTLSPGELVAIFGMQGITLLVAGLAPEDGPASETEAPANEMAVALNGNRRYGGQGLSSGRGTARRF